MSPRPHELMIGVGQIAPVRLEREATLARVEACLREAGAGLLYAVVDHSRVREERQNLDGVGHYSRPDVTRLLVNTERQSVAEFRRGSIGDGDSDPRM